MTTSERALSIVVRDRPCVPAVSKLCEQTQRKVRRSLFTKLPGPPTKDLLSPPPLDSVDDITPWREFFTNSRNTSGLIETLVSRKAYKRKINRLVDLCIVSGRYASSEQRENIGMSYALLRSVVVK